MRTDVLVDDVRRAWRRMVSQPGTILGAAAMLGVGIGLTTATFTIADSLLFKSVPFRDPGRLAQLTMANRAGGPLTVPVSVYEAWREIRVLDAVEAANAETFLIDTDGGPIERRGALVTSGLFDMLDVRPIRGRLFEPGEGRAGTDDVVLISEDLWRSVYGADPEMIGRKIVIQDASVYVVGILPGDFRFPEGNTLLWRPIDYGAPPPQWASTVPIAFVRFAADVTRPDALRIATEAAHAVESDLRSWELVATPRPLGGLRNDAYYSRAIRLLFASVALVFLVLCANASSLLLVRVGDRRRDFGLRSALGASRTRLLSQALAEMTVLWVGGSAIGVALAFVLVSTSRAVLPESFLLHTLNPMNLDTRALLSACGFGAQATLAAGIPPAFVGTRVSLSEALRSVGHGSTESQASRAVTRTLIVTEIALSCALLVGATLLVRSFVNIVTADRGLETRGVVTASIWLRSSDLPDSAAQDALRIAVESELRSLPGVRQLALSFGVPPAGGYVHLDHEWRPATAGSAAIAMTAYSYDVGADFFQLYEIPLLSGRTFRDGDSRVDVVVGERMAELLWPGLDPVGRSFTYGDERFSVIGLAGETSFPSIDPSLDLPEFYKPVRSLGAYFMASLRCASECPNAASIRQRLVRLSADVDVVDVGPLEAKYAEQFAQVRALAALGAAFACVALLAAAGGLFGVLTLAVSRRRRELGVRTALGATGRELRGLVLRDGLAILLAGVLIGCGFAWALARSFRAFQYGVTSGDPLSWVFVVVTLVATTLLASWWPAREAAKADPVALLREG